MLVTTGPHACEGSVCVCAGGGRARGRGPSRQGHAWLSVLRLHLAGKLGAAGGPAALITTSPLPPDRIYIRATRLNFYSPGSAPVARAQARNKGPRAQTPAPRLWPAGSASRPRGSSRPRRDGFLHPPSSAYTPDSLPARVPGSPLSLKEPVCVLRPPCDSGSCLLAGASIPAQLDLGGTTLPGLGRRASKTTKKPKMNKQYDQPKTGGSSTPARRLLLLPSLEAL
ncbi:PREDICTED: uncharacterized protein LOC101374119 [Odobenus rosmarus divergens]|uniref:Uncharacterized protein LOC101374119 n=1 Tax=Odobenus rosmarus divergens TaxID=9708 RepID=A0A2U3W5F8_ODORO|nr:PREDICTED: uncharacterized protein LOC101374119 [Odobenus rosmarus divergens]